MKPDQPRSLDTLPSISSWYWEENLPQDSRNSHQETAGTSEHKATVYLETEHTDIRMINDDDEAALAAGVPSKRRRTEDYFEETVLAPVPEQDMYTPTPAITYQNPRRHRREHSNSTNQDFSSLPPGVRKVRKSLSVGIARASPKWKLRPGTTQSLDTEYMSKDAHVDKDGSIDHFRTSLGDDLEEGDMVYDRQAFLDDFEAAARDNDFLRHSAPPQVVPGHEYPHLVPYRMLSLSETQSNTTKTGQPISNLDKL